MHPPREPPQTSHPHLLCELNQRLVGGTRMGYWYCYGCGRQLDKPEMELHVDICSFAKLPKSKRERTEEN
jgi:hypothetical protein